MVASYLSVLRRRWLTIALLTAVLGAGFFTLLNGGADTYTSTAVVQTRTEGVTEAVLGQSSGYREPAQQLASELETIRSRAVLSRARELAAAQGRQLTEDQLERRLTTSTRGISTFIEVSARDSSPEGAFYLTEAVVTAYAGYRQEQARAELQQVAEDLETRLTAAEDEIATLDAQSGDSGPVARQRAAALARYDSLTELLERVRLRLSLDLSSVVVTSPPSVPEEPDALLPAPTAAVLSALGALLVAVGVALLVDLAKDPVRTRAEVRLLLDQDPIGELARIGGEPDAFVRALRSADHPTTAAARTLRLRLMAAGRGRVPVPVEVRAHPHDRWAGTRVATALAAACGRAGRQTLLLLEPEDLVVLAAAPTSEAPAPRQLVDGLVARPSALPGVFVVPSVSASGPQGSSGLLDTPSPTATLAALGELFEEVVLLLPPSDDGLDVPPVQAVGGARLTVCVLGRTSAEWLQRTAASTAEDADVTGTVVVSGRPSSTRRAGRPRRGRRGRGRSSLAPAPTDPAQAPAAASASGPGVVPPGQGPTGWPDDVVRAP